ncbi:MetQ/NlpA family ABC transporter substrate-binding protein [Streptomyces palmae]|uniref:MetQ/NlpA family ABC transporter substrate-binding protein n=1 Tax=Streptomyces palmae TaxID=1701085 RepID=UPI00143310A1|nr:MetQ/NlpA family ABC transporter substrate-binding protein [Streptomyces palmae]
MRNTIKISAIALTVGALALGATACGPDSGGKDGALVVAATPVPHAEILNYVKDHLADKAGLKLEVREFTDYVTPNTATEDGSVDANFFQHQAYLDDFNKKKGTHLVPAVTVHLEPLGLYSHNAKSPKDIEKGATIGIPNDTSNEARALKLLEDNKLITLKSDAGNEATPADIAENPKGLKFKELEAAMLPRSLDDVDAAVINGNYAIEADLKPGKDALALESPKDNPYGNILVVKQGHEKDPQVKKLVKLLTSPEVKKFIEEKYDGAVIPSF